MDGLKRQQNTRRTRPAGCRRLGQPGTARGFTIVELVAVIVLLSILGVTAMSRMVSPDAFAPAITTQALIAESRFAQQLASSRHDAVVTLTVDRSGDDYRFQIRADANVVRTELVGAENTSVAASSGAASATLGAGTPLVVGFDHYGDLSSVTVGGTAGNPGAGVSLTVSGDSTRQACIYSSGYANDAACI